MCGWACVGQRGEVLTREGARESSEGEGRGALRWGALGWGAAESSESEGLGWWRGGCLVRGSWMQAGVGVGGLRAGRGAGELSGVRGGGLGAQEQGLEDSVLGQAGVGLRVRGFSGISGSWAASRPRGEEEKARGVYCRGMGQGHLGHLGVLSCLVSARDSQQEAEDHPAAMPPPLVLLGRSRAGLERDSLPPHWVRAGPGASLYQGQ